LEVLHKSFPKKQMQSSDPRRSAAERAFKIALPNGGTEELDYFSLLALFFGMIGLFLKLKICVWMSLVFCIVSVCNLRTSEIEYRQIFSSFSISLMALLMAYVGPQASFFQ